MFMANPSNQAKALKELLDRHRTSITSAAALADIKRPTFNNWMVGPNQFDTAKIDHFQVAKKLCAHFEEPVETITRVKNEEPDQAITGGPQSMETMLEIFFKVIEDSEFTEGQKATAKDAIKRMVLRG